ncbi:Valine--tRNA ligase, mitochondrial 1 [Sphaceloma murrayae]|uniref:Valine--tRNA ligase, mitochondrial 1 n=1 Tax=Sphaceloma murrayae TaxID=2082308 RepID=A0A2K1QVD3_9PEZI|nr:Valine--tRNA ligase, mitochondrial 1 [Sphaceloma murrayae]
MASPSLSTIERKGPLLLRPMLPRDSEAYLRIVDHAFQDTMTALFFPNGKTPADEDWSRQALHRAMTRDAHFTTHLVCIDTSSPPLPSDIARLSASDAADAKAEGRVAGISVWKIHPRQRTQAELDEEAQRSEEGGLPPTARQEVLDAFFGAIKRCKSKWLPDGQAHVLLHLLGTDPEYHRRGIGGMHLRWGLGEADRLGVVGYLEGTEDGVPLYQRYGFEGREMMPFDHEALGTREVRCLIMIRPAKASS